jgi:hypothetical protein
MVEGGKRVGISEVYKATRIGPIGLCIYCRAKHALTEEHVVPLALGGQLILTEASCHPCAKITSAFEGKVLRGFMRDARSAGSFPTRHPKARPTTISYEIKRGNYFESIEIPIAVATGFLQLPILQPPAFLNGRLPVRGTNIIGFETIAFGKRPDEVISAVGTDALRATVSIDASAFVRMLAKIGYCCAIAAIGTFPRSEIPVLPLILGTADDASTWVGSSEYSLAGEAQRPQHVLGLISVNMLVEDTPEEIFIARIKLFADTGATGYEVVVRRRKC